MGTPAWAIPVAVLSALCVAMFGFIWWYIPRAYMRGVRADMARVDADKAARAQRALALQETDAGAGDLEAGGGAVDGVAAPAKPAFRYTAPAYTVY